MKKILFLLLITSKVFSQNDFIITNLGEKIDVKDESVTINYADKSLEYNTLDRNKSKSIDFSEFSYCYFEGYVFMTFDLYKNNSIKGYFVVADTKNRKLLSVVLPPDNDAYNKFKDQTIKYEYFVIDEKENVIEHNTIDNLKIESNTAARGLLPMVLKYCG